VSAAPSLTLVDDPTDHRSFGAEAVDGEGLACRRNVLVADGVLEGFLFDSASGRRAGRPSTGSAVRGVSSTPTVGCQALAVEPGAGTHDELVASVDRGILVQSMTGWHSGVNAVSGDFSVGVEGLLIRDVRAVGADVEWLPSGTGCPTLVIADLSLSGS
jgi:PmbA protein